MALTRVTAGLKSTILQLNQIINHLEGVAGNTLSWFLRTATNENFIIVLGDDAGVSEFQLMDSNEVVVFTIDSEGNVTPGGAFSPGSIIVPGEAAPSQTTLGDLQFDEDGFFLTIGTGSATKRLGLVVGAAATPTVSGEMAYDTTSGRLLVHDGTSARALTPVWKYAAATQSRADATYVDVIAAGSPATMTFTVAANEVWHARYHLRFVYTGTGGLGLKLQGPAAPTALRITGTLQADDVFGSADAVRGVLRSFSAITAFNTVFASRSAAAASLNAFSTTDSGAIIEVDVLLINGSTAGDVTLQMAQAAANGTTVLQIGSWMEAVRVA